MSRRRALAVIALSGLSGCGFEPIQWQPETSPTPSVGNAASTEARPDFFAQSSDIGEKSIPGAKAINQRVSTPHFDARLTAIQISDELSGEVSAQLRQPGALVAPSQHEFLTFVLQGGQPSFMEAENRVATTQLGIGDTTYPLSSPFGRFNPSTGEYEIRWVMVAATVPIGAKLNLLVRDQDRTVSIDLRTGRPIDDEHWAATRGFRERWQVASKPSEALYSRQVQTTPADPKVQPQTAGLTISLKPDLSGALVPWNPDRGWAPVGQQWLKVPMNAQIAFAATESAAFNLALDLQRSFSYLDAAGRVRKPQPEETISSEEIRTGQRELEVTWLVSGKDEKAQLRSTPTGSLTASYSDYPDVPAKFTTGANPLVFELAFEPATQPW